MLSKDLLEILQSADETKTYIKAKLQNTPTFTGNGSHSHVCLLLVIKIKTCTYQVCKRQSADNNVLTGDIDYRPIIDACLVIGHTDKLWPQFCSHSLSV